VIEQFPGRRVEGDVADEAAGAIVLERETHVEDLSVVAVGVEIRALADRSGQACDDDDRCLAFLAKRSQNHLWRRFSKSKPLEVRG
jgi:hypothetical protein